MEKVCGHLRALDIQPYVVKWVKLQTRVTAFDYVQQGGNVQTFWTSAVVGNQ